MVKGNFADMVALAETNGLQEVDGILLDLGVSSDQLDTPERGFSFRADGPLDMRMDATQRTSAARLVNTLAEQDLAELLWRLGEEPAARRVARAIVSERERAPIETTARLAALVARVKHGRQGRTDPATRVFQALRIAVNDELDSLTRGLDAALRLLKRGGRMAVISFHSLEDREVKNFFRRHAGRWEAQQAGGQAWVGERPAVGLVARKPVTPSVEECEQNPRARSAKLRVAQRED